MPKRSIYEATSFRLTGEISWLAFSLIVECSWLGALRPLAGGLSGLWSPAQAKTLAPMRFMRGGSNNYQPNAPIVEWICGGGFWIKGTIGQAGDGKPLASQRIQIWAHTTEGYESDWARHGATLTDENGVFRLEMPQIVSAFGQPHGHLAYDSGDYETLFLRPVIKRAWDKSLKAHFVLKPA